MSTKKTIDWIHKDTTPTPREILEKIRTAKPGVRYALNAEQDKIAAWDVDYSRWVVVAMKTLTGGWSASGLPVLVNRTPIDFIPLPDYDVEVPLSKPEPKIP